MVRQTAMIVKCILLMYYRNTKGRSYRRQVINHSTFVTLDSCDVHLGVFLDSSAVLLFLYNQGAITDFAFLVRVKC